MCAVPSWRQNRNVAGSYQSLSIGDLQRAGDTPRHLDATLRSTARGYRNKSGPPAGSCRVTNADPRTGNHGKSTRA